MARVESRHGRRLCANNAAERRRRDHGASASQFGRRRGQQEDFCRHGRHGDQNGRGAVAICEISRRRRDPEPAGRSAAVERTDRRHRDQSRRLSRAERAGRRRQVESCGRCSAARQQWQARPSLCRDGGWLARRNSRGQKSDRADRVPPRPFLRAGGGDPRHPSLVRQELRCAGRHARAEPGRRCSGRQSDILQDRFTDRSHQRADPRPHRLRRGGHRSVPRRSSRPMD